ncbi:hypothetical protein GRJ2_001021200 [Grus japonensis]|uniref:Uncharacterized protein n=1 Tax=Grus japonensis TaxID=30415 RepID=A0ABC9WL56_GRUJA
MPAGSEMDLPLAKAKPIRDKGWQRLWDNRGKKGKKPVQQKEQLQPERGVRICERNNSADTKASAEGGQEVLQALEQRSPCSHGKDHVESVLPMSVIIE